MAKALELTKETTDWLAARDEAFKARAEGLLADQPDPFPPGSLGGISDQPYVQGGIYDKGTVQAALARVQDKLGELTAALGEAAKPGDKDNITVQIEALTEEVATIQAQLSSTDENDQPTQPATPPHTATTEQALDLYRSDSPSDKTGMDQVATLANQINLMEGFSKARASRAQRLVHLMEHHRIRLSQYQVRSAWLQQALISPNQVRAQYVKI